MMPGSLPEATRWIVRTVLFILLLAPICRGQEDTRQRVLLLDSFDQEFPPLDAFKGTLRTELRKLSPQRLAFYELSLQPARASANPDEESFLRYVLSTFKGQELDLIVTIGGPAARFAQKYRDRLFPSTPILLAANINVPPQLPGPTVFDGRELRRWSIGKDRLPQDSIIRFKSPTAWEEYKWYVLAGGAFAVLQTLLVVGLAINLVQRKRVERSLRAAEKLAQDFSRRLIQAQETERAHVAREIHDDMSQRMVALQFDLQALMNSRHGESMRENRSLLAETSERMASVTTSLRQLSHRLHPAHLRLLGIRKPCGTCSANCQQQG